jgi:hypothetical protein
MHTKRTMDAPNCMIVTVSERMLCETAGLPNDRLRFTRKR